VEYTVAKNTLARFAAQRTGREAIIPDLEGPTAIAFVYDDMAAATKALQDFIRTNRVLSVKAGSLGSQRLSAADVTRIAELPSKAQLQARLVGTIMGPMAGLVGVFNGVLSNLVYVLDERAKQLDGGAEAAAS
jgi:large subunit ribosomal protein L10